MKVERKGKGKEKKRRKEEEKEKEKEQKKEENKTKERGKELTGRRKRGREGKGRKGKGRQKAGSRRQKGYGGDTHPSSAGTVRGSQAWPCATGHIAPALPHGTTQPHDMAGSYSRTQPHSTAPQHSPMAWQGPTTLHGPTAQPQHTAPWHGMVLQHYIVPRHSPMAQPAPPAESHRPPSLAPLTTGIPPSALWESPSPWPRSEAAQGWRGAGSGTPNPQPSSGEQHPARRVWQHRTRGGICHPSCPLPARQELGARPGQQLWPWGRHWGGNSGCWHNGAPSSFIRRVQGSFCSPSPSAVDVAPWLGPRG